MSEFLCDGCDKDFRSKKALTYHIANKACKERDFSCRFCNKNFTSDTNMYRHIRNSCKVKQEADEERNKIYERLLELEKQAQLVKKVENDNKMLKKQVAKMQKECAKAQTSNINNGTVTTNVINNNINNNQQVILVAYGKEDMSKIDKKDIQSVFATGFYSTIGLTKMIHFNPKYPEYHNIYISNVKGKYAMMFDGTNWTLTQKDALIDKIYDDKRNYIEENLEEFIKSLPKSRRDALERWLEIDDDDEDENNLKKIREIKDNIRMLLYNSRNVPIKTSEMIAESKSNKVPVRKTITNNGCHPIVNRDDIVINTMPINNSIDESVSETSDTSNTSDDTNDYNYNCVENCDN